MNLRSGTVGRSYLVTLWTFGVKPTFERADAAILFCRVVGRLRQRLSFRVHAYVILPDRARLILGSDDPDPAWIALVVQHLKQRFAREWNTHCGRLGLVWQDADQRLPLRDADDIVRRAAVLHQNPILAGLASDAAGWRFSSHRAWTSRARTPLRVDLPEGIAAARPAPSIPGARPTRLSG